MVDRAGDGSGDGQGRRERAPGRPDGRRCARAPRRRAVGVASAAAVGLLLLAGCGGGRGGDAGPGAGSTAGPSVVGPVGTVPGVVPRTATVRPAVTPTGVTVEGTLATPDGRVRTYRLYVPPGLPADETVPLLVALHGGTGSAAQFEANSGLDGLAEANGFVVVYPDGIGAGPGEDALRTWNGGYCCGRAAREGVDDVGFVSRLIDTIGATRPVDPARVFVTGHSNGAILGYRLACELSDRVAGVAVQAGSLGVDDCRPSRPVSLLHLHGTADENHPIDGGRGAKGISGTDFHPAVDGVRAVAAADGCPGDATTSGRADNPDVAVTAWSPCPDGTEVALVAVTGASHAWMGHPSSAPRLVGEAYEGLDASVEVWAFLSAHPRPPG